MATLKRQLSYESDSDEQYEHDSKVRKPTVYDAVVGRSGRRSFLPADHHNPKLGGPLRPDEILYKGADAPIRYEETDHYFAHAELPEDQKLPSGGLLSAIHGYFSQFYSRSVGHVDPRVYRSMDETALLAFGILMEETAREVLGWNGHLAFLESDEEGDDGHSGVDEEHEEEREDEKEGVGEVKGSKSASSTGLEEDEQEDELDSSSEESLQSSSSSE